MRVNRWARLPLGEWPLPRAFENQLVPGQVWPRWSMGPLTSAFLREGADQGGLLPCFDRPLLCPGSVTGAGRCVTGVCAP